MNWQLWVSPLIALVALSFAVYTHRANRKPKRLAYEIQTDREIIAQSRYTERWKELSVQFGDIPVQRPRIAALRVVNVGKTEARADDFDEPLAVSMTGQDKILASAILLRLKGGERVEELQPDTADFGSSRSPQTTAERGRCHRIPTADRRQQRQSATERASGWLSTFGTPGPS